MPAKRPMGLGKTARLKRAKNTGSATIETSDTTDSVTQTPDIEIEIADGADEEEAEADGLFDTLRKDRNARLARGLVHECDQLLRTREALSSRLWAGYGTALLTLAELGETSQEDPASEFRISALKAFDNIPVTQWDPSRAIAARELLRHADFLVSAPEDLSGMSCERDAKRAVTPLLARVFDFINISKDEVLNAGSELPQVYVAIAQLAEAAAEWDEVRNPDENSDLPLSKLLGLLQDSCRLLIASDRVYEEAAATKRYANKSLGYNAQRLAGYNLERGESEAAIGLLREAIAAFENGLDEQDPQSYVICAENLLVYADISSSGNNEDGKNEDSQPIDDPLGLALRYLRKAQLLGVENLHEVIEELESK